MYDLTTLIPDQTFTTSIGHIILCPFKFKKAKEALDIINKYKTIILTPKTIKYTDNEGKEQTTTVDKEVIDIVDPIMDLQSDGNYGVIDDVIAILTLSIKADPVTVLNIKANLEELGYQEIVYLLSIVVKLNKDFFTQISDLFQPPQVVELPKVGVSESAV